MVPNKFIFFILQENQKDFIKELKVIKKLEEQSGIAIGEHMGWLSLDNLTAEIVAIQQKQVVEVLFAIAQRYAFVFPDTKYDTSSV